MNSYRIGNESKYELFKYHKLGIGKHSVVYLGRCLNQDKKIIIGRDDGYVAIKKIDMRNFSEEIHKITRNEIYILNKLKNNPHKNIVKCFDIIEDVDITYIITEYCDGGTMNSILIKPIKMEYIKYYFGQLIDSIYFLHENNIIHRDIKPANILFTNNMKMIKLCDFGFSEDLSLKKNNALNSMCGSPLYMAPEILLRKSCDMTIDIWALGIILFEMMFGFHPFYDCKDMHQLIESISENKLYKSELKYINFTVFSEDMELLEKFLKYDSINRIDLKDSNINRWKKNMYADMSNNFNISDIYYFNEIKKSMENTDENNDDIFEMD